MKWTKNKPTKIGWYWYKDGLTDSPVIGKVSRQEKDLYFDDGCELCFVIGKDKETDKMTWWSDENIEEPKN